MMTSTFVTPWHPLRTRLLTQTRFMRDTKYNYRLVRNITATATHRQQASTTTKPQPQSPMFSSNTFQQLGISASTIASLSDSGITTPTNIQATTIPLLRRALQHQLTYAAIVKTADEGDPDAPRPTPAEEDTDDVFMVGAETGSGKTLAYLIPYLEALQTTSIDLKAIILVPTRELCQQVDTFLKLFTDPPKSLLLAGGTPPEVSQVSDVKVLIATPAALLNHFRFSKKHDASDKFIVIDEADMLLSRSFLSYVEKILDQPGMKPFATRKNGVIRRQNRNRLLFIGATYPHWTGEKVRSIVTWMKRRYPDVRSVQTDHIHKKSDMLQSRWWYVKNDDERLDLLERVLRDVDDGEKVMVFAAKASTVERVCSTMEARLRDDITKFGHVLQLHKHIHGKERIDNLQSFRDSTGRLLFCTDLAARGLDLGHVTRVIEYEFSGNVVGYLHRIGRTARAGKRGFTEHFYDDVTKPLADAIRERADDGDTVVEGVFSRNRSFRRKLKKRLAEEGLVRGISDEDIDDVDEEEEARLRDE